MGFNLRKVFSAIFVDKETGKEMCNTNIEFSDSGDIYSSGGNGSKEIQKTYTATLENTNIDPDVLREFVSIDGNTKLKMICSEKRLEKLEFIQKRTKNRRIKNKIRNKIEKKYSHPVYQQGVMIKAEDISFV